MSVSGRSKPEVIDFSTRVGKIYGVVMVAFIYGFVAWIFQVNEAIGLVVAVLVSIGLVRAVAAMEDRLRLVEKENYILRANVSKSVLRRLAAQGSVPPEERK